jgi:hypothetical protein
MKVNVGLTKKIGLRDYGSLGATCAVEFESDHGLLDDLDGFHQRVKNVFAACRQAVNDELARQQSAVAPSSGTSNGQTNAEAAVQPVSTANAKPQNGSGDNRTGNGHLASEKQVTYLRQLAKQVEGLGVRRLETLAQKLFNKPMAALTSFDASSLIDTLKAIKAGEINLDNALNGAAT